MGDYPVGWQAITLGEAATWLSGGTPRTEEPSYWNGDIPWITSGSLTEWRLKRSDRRLTAEGVANGSRLVPPGTVIFVVRGMSLKTEFRIGIADRSLAFGQDCKALQAVEGLDDLYLAYAIKSQTAEILDLVDEAGHGTGRLNTDQIKAVRIGLPPIAEQRAIAGVLGALDDKIESNRRLVRALEQAGRAELELALCGPNGEAWEFAWPEIQLGKVLNVIETGDRPKGGVAGVANGVPSVGAESIVAPGVFDFSKTKFVPEDYFAGMRRGVLQSGDVLLYKDGGTPGNFIPKVSMCQDGFPFEVAALNSHVYRLRIAPPYSQALLYFWLSSQRLLEEMWLRGTGAAIPSLNSTNVKGLPFPVIPSSVLAGVLPLVDELMSRLHRAAREQRALEQLRDALLPELLSGRLRVRDAEGVLEEAV